jgi:hypothetical protein
MINLQKNIFLSKVQNFCVPGTGTMTATPTETNTVLGIAFGNSTTQISFISRAGVPECLANEDGERQIPSTLSYSEGEEYHGGQAKSQLVRNPANTVVSFRDWLGQKYLFPLIALILDTTQSTLRERDIQRNQSLLNQGMSRSQSRHWLRRYGQHLLHRVFQGHRLLFERANRHPFLLLVYWSRNS